MLYIDMYVRLPSTETVAVNYYPKYRLEEIAAAFFTVLLLSSYVFSTSSVDGNPAGTTPHVSPIGDDSNS
jgi:hypothetical protein